MSMVARVHKLQIERIIRRSSRNVEAEFRKDGAWLCRAWFVKGESDSMELLSRGGVMGTETASALSIALSMALDWLAEESANR